MAQVGAVSLVIDAPFARPSGSARRYLESYEEPELERDMMAQARGRRPARRTTCWPPGPTWTRPGSGSSGTAGAPRSAPMSPRSTTDRPPS